MAPLTPLTEMALLTAMAAVQAADARASFLFVGDLNGHHQEWLGSTTTNRHGVAAFYFATVSGCDQLVIGPTHARGETLYLLMTDVPDHGTGGYCSTTRYFRSFITLDSYFDGTGYS